MNFVTLFFAEYSGYVLIAFVAAVLIRNFKKNISVIVQLGAAAILSRGIITPILRFLFPRERPSTLYETGSSFPSGHASFYFALTAVLYFYNKKLGIFAFLVSVVMGIARVFAGYHWPFDIVGGAVVGILSGVLVVQLSKKFYVQES